MMQQSCNLLFAQTIGMILFLLCTNAIAFSQLKPCSTDTDCSSNQRCIRFSIEKQNAKTYCAANNNANTKLWLSYQNAKSLGAPVHLGYRGIVASRIMMYSGIAISGGFVIVGLLSLMSKGFSGEDEFNMTPYAIGVFTGFGIYSISGSISNVSMQRRHNAYKKMGFRPSSSVASISWTMGSLSVASFGTATAILIASSGESDAGLYMMIPASICSPLVGFLQEYWNRQLHRSVPPNAPKSVRWYPVIRQTTNRARQPDGLTVGMGGTF